jgi:hypothetical protein
VRWPFSKRPQRPKFERLRDMGALSELQRRCVTFLEREVPAEIAYVPNSITELWMKQFVAGEPFDAEMMELLEICGMEALNSRERMETPEAKAYFQESAEILEAMWDELQQ